LRKLFTLLLGFTTSCVFSQENLVINPSFELMEFCPSDYTMDKLKAVQAWTQIGMGTPDYFHACSKKVGVPNNVFGIQEARTGVGYIGLGTYLRSKPNYREYAMSKLSRPLNKGEMVCITLYYSAADYCQFVHDGLSVVFTTKPTVQINSKPLLIKNPAMTNPRFNMLDDNEGWTYTAQGGETYLTIGNFKNDNELRVIRRTADTGAKDNKEYSYIYIDDVSVIPIQDKKACSCVNEYLASIAVDPPLELLEYDQIKLDAVHFAFDSDQLSDSALIQLDQLYKLMKKNKSMYMEILGHTDNVGSDQYNQTLSRKRADAVIQNLVTRGIARERFQESALGFSQPTAPNDTEAGRAQNRRVEFHIRRHKFELVQ
jgi:outer membrane protein OmpA-like peptidoglycan-associated protein